jgi:excisionase family DNA binding protein
MMRYTAEIQAHIINWTAAGIPPREQARRVGVNYAALLQCRRRMAERGLLSIVPRPAWASWTPQELAKLDEMLQRGCSYARIARRLKRTVVSVQIKCKRLGWSMSNQSGLYTGREAADLLGLGCSKTVSDWITRGWLKATNCATPPRRIWRIADEDLWAFLERPEHWMAWHPERITDSDLRSWATEMRAGRPQWLTIGQVARRYHVATNTVGQWIHKGWLPAARYGNHWINEADLVDFHPESTQPLTPGTMDAKRLKLRKAAA